MAILTATFSDGHLEFLTVDAILTEGYNDDATVTDNPVEQGSDVTDNIRPEPEKLALQIVVTNTPLGSLTPLSSGFAEQAFKRLGSWKNRGALLTVPLTMGLRTNMAITGCGVQRDAKTGGKPGATGGVHISLALKEIRLVQNKLTQITVSADKRVGAKVKTGNQSTTDTDPEVEDAANKLGIGKILQSLTQVGPPAP